MKGHTAPQSHCGSNSPPVKVTSKYSTHSMMHDEEEVDYNLYTKCQRLEEHRSSQVRWPAIKFVNICYANTIIWDKWTVAFPF